MPSKPKQTRRGVSMSRGHYNKLKRLSRLQERSMAQVVERLIDVAFAVDEASAEGMVKAAEEAEEGR